MDGACEGQGDGNKKGKSKGPLRSRGKMFKGMGDGMI